MSAGPAPPGPHGRLDPVANTTHLTLPGTSTTLCAEAVGAGWDPPSTEAVPVNCAQCLTNRYWGPAEGRFARDAPMNKVIEPWPAHAQRNVTDNDDPGRGRFARPPNLQLCLLCSEMRGPYSRFDNPCRCDLRQWHPDPKPRYGDLTNNVHLCKSCLSRLVPSGTRWSPFYCDTCRPAVTTLRRMSGRSVVPLGPHSIMNGTCWSPGSHAGAMTVEQAVALADQLSACFTSVGALQALTRERTAARAAALSFTGHAVLATDYLEACRAAGFTAERGFMDFIDALGAEDGDSLVAELWRLAVEAAE